jgi:hypothetical protein
MKDSAKLLLFLWVMGAMTLMGSTRVLATYVGTQSLFDLSGKSLGTVESYAFNDDTVRVGFQFNKEIASSYWDWPAHIQVLGIPKSQNVYYSHGVNGTGDEQSAGNILLTRVVPLGSVDHEEAIPFSVDVTTTTCYHGNIPGGDCDPTYDIISSLGLNFLISATVDPQVFYLYVGGSDNMAAIRPNSGLGAGAHEFVSLGQKVWQSRVYFDASTKTFFSCDGNRECNEANYDTKTVFGANFSSPTTYNAARTYGGVKLGSLTQYGWSTCANAYINENATYTSVRDPIGINLGLSGCTMFGTMTNSAAFVEFFPGTQLVTLYPSGGTFTKVVSGYSNTQIQAFAMNGAIGYSGFGNSYYGPTLIFPSGGLYVNSTTDTFYGNRSIYMNYWITYSGQDKALSEIWGIPSSNSANWDSLQTAYGIVDSAGATRKLWNNIFPKTTLLGNDMLRYYRTTFDKLYMTEWASFPDQAEAYARGGGQDIITVYFGDFESACLDTYNYCDKLSDDKYWALLSCNSDQSQLGYVNNCGEWTSCVSCYGTCYKLVPTAHNAYQCGSSCLHDYVYYSHCDTMNANRTYTSVCKGIRTQSCPAGCDLDGYTCVNSDYLHSVLFTVVGTDTSGTMNLANATVSGHNTVVGFNNTFSCVTFYSDTFGVSCMQFIPPGTYDVSVSVPGYSSTYTGRRSTGDVVIWNSDSTTIGMAVPSQVSTNAYEEVSIAVRSTVLSANYTGLTIKVYNDIEPAIVGANVTIYFNTTYTESRLSGADGKASFNINLEYVPIGVVVTKAGYNTHSDSIGTSGGLVIGKPDNTYNVILEPNGSVHVQGGGTESGKIIGSGLFSLLGTASSTIDIPVYFDKPGKVVVTQDRVRIRMCKQSFFDVIPLLNDVLGCTDFEDLLVACAWVPMDSGGIIAYNITSNVTNKFGTIGRVSATELSRRIQSGDMACRFKDDDEGNMILGPNGDYQLACSSKSGLTQYSSEAEATSGDKVYDLTFTVLSGWLDIGATVTMNPTLSTYATQYRLKSPILERLAEIYSPGQQDIYTKDVVMQCDTIALFKAITDNAQTSVTIGGQSIPGRPIDILVTPAYKQYVASSRPPPVLSLGDTSQGLYSPSDVTLDIDLDKAEYGSLIYSSSVSSGLHYLPISRDLMMTSIHNDLVNGVEDGSTYMLDAKAIPHSRKFYVEQYLRIEHIPADGSVPSIDYALVPMYTDNFNTDIWMTIVIIVGIILIAFGPLILGFYAVMNRRK